MSKPIEKYFVIELKGKTSLAYHHTYATDRATAEAEAISEQVRLGNAGAEVISVTELGFEIGDTVRVDKEQFEGELEPYHSTPGKIARYEFDGYIVVRWDDLDIEEEFHWTELEKVI